MRAALAEVDQRAGVRRAGDEMPGVDHAHAVPEVVHTPVAGQRGLRRAAFVQGNAVIADVAIQFVEAVEPVIGVVGEPVGAAAVEIDVSGRAGVENRHAIAAVAHAHRVGERIEGRGPIIEGAGGGDITHGVLAA